MSAAVDIRGNLNGFRTVDTLRKRGVAFNSSHKTEVMAPVMAVDWLQTRPAGG